ncbi:MAG: hypothetical protein HC866_14200 [Leptolyngbyaceae cyanobacterium RU_5_1]|nr:hypothetical protein [Leptolyngbyaceae cyanobacterium RU_5_1]
MGVQKSKFTAGHLLKHVNDMIGAQQGSIVTAATDVIKRSRDAIKSPADTPRVS